MSGPLLERTPRGELLFVTESASIKNVVFGPQFEICIQNAILGANYRIVIETLMQGSIGEQMIAVDPENMSDDDKCALASLQGQSLEKLSVAADGTLDVVCSAGRLRVRVHPEYEAWQVSADSTLVVAEPGGNIAVWATNQ